MLTVASDSAVAWDTPAVKEILAIPEVKHIQVVLDLLAVEHMLDLEDLQVRLVLVDRLDTTVAEGTLVVKDT